MSVLAIALMVETLAVRAALQAPPAADPTDPPARVARVSYLQGNVSFQPAGDTTWSAATLNFAATTGDRLYSDHDSRAELQIGRVTVRLSESTDLTITNLTDDFLQLGLDQGTIRLSVYRLASGDSIEVDTPNGTLSPLEPGRYRIEAGTDGAALVSIERGSLAVSAGDVQETVAQGQAVRLSGANPVQVSDVAAPGSDSFDEWSDTRDRRLGSSRTAQYVSSEIPGYDDLDEAGNWQVDLVYGPLWYPAALSPDWVPYRYGHWVWIEPWGWTWVEDEPWGFAPFHYGRWVRVGVAWAWWPGPFLGPPCYAPALVAFLDAGPWGYAGGGAVWFPLGPNEPYFPWYHHSPPYRIRVNQGNVRNGTNITDVVRRRRDLATFPYVNRSIATTAVPTTTLRNAEPVAPHILQITPEEVKRAVVTPHPAAVPAPRAAAGGPPAPRAPRTARPLITVVPPPRAAPVARPPAIRPVPSGSGAVTPPLVAKKPPPPALPSFPAREKAMQTHPGRPLEPQQIENLRAGRPAGRVRDQEFPPHAAPPPRAAPPARTPAKKPGRGGTTW